MKRILLTHLLALMCLFARAQLAVTPGASGADVINYLQGQGIVISNVQINCPNNAWGQYNLGAGNQITPQQLPGFSNQGLLMTTGTINVAVGPNNSPSAGNGNGGGLLIY